MAVDTVDKIAAGMKPALTFMKNAFTGEAAGHWHDLGLVGGNPGLRTLGSPGLAGQTVTSNALGGALAFNNPVSGESRLARMTAAVGTNIIGIMFYDLLWYNTGTAITTTTAQTVNSVVFPARDKNETTNGDGVEIWQVCTTATTNASAITNTTISYTDQAGVAGKTGALLQSWPATAVAGTAVPFAVAASDTGVRSVQSHTLGTTYTAGAISLFAIRPITSVFMYSSASGALLDWASLGLPKLPNGRAVYAMALMSGTAGGAISGHLNETHG